jgi:predicted transcriptional regulator
MAKPPVPRPTDAELAILRVLWERGPSTVRQVHEVLAEGRLRRAPSSRQLAYTTTLKLLQIMTDKGLTAREEQGRGHVYQARFGEEETQRRLVGDLLERAFGGSAAKLVLQALATRRASAEELREIRRMLDSGHGSTRTDSSHGSTRTDSSHGSTRTDSGRGYTRKDTE